MRDAFVRSLSELASTDSRVMLITGDLGFGVLDEFRARFPKQFLNAGVAEQNMTGLASGIALEGRTVFTYSIANFPILRCLEQIRNDAAYHDADVKVVSIGGGFSYGALGMSHHATEDIAIMRALPMVTVVAPGDLWEAAEATKAIAATHGVCYLRLDKSAAKPTHEAGERFALGKARVVRRGAHIAIISCGGILGEVLSAAEELRSSGIVPTIVSLHTVKPIDQEAVLEIVGSHDAIITVEEHGLAGGLGSAISEVLMDAGQIPRQFKRLAIRGNAYVSVVGSQEYLRKQSGLDGPSIAEEVRRMVSSASVA